MKRILFLASLSLAALFAAGSLANGQDSSPGATPRAATKQVTASTTPRRDRTRPYTFTTRGRVVPPSKFCAPGAAVEGGNCVALICPSGTTNPAYCQTPPKSAICSGKVNVRFQKRTTTVSSRNVSLRSNCTYRSRVSFRTRAASRRGALSVRARFQGNALLLPKNSSRHTVRAG